MRQIFGEIRWEVKALIFLGLTLAFALFGPFGTYVEMTLPERLAFWTGVMFFVAFFIHIAVHVALTTPLLARWRPVARVFVGVVIGAMPAATMVAFIDRMFRGSEIDMSGIALIWWQITLIAAVVAPLEYLDFRATGAVPAKVRSKLHDRLSPDMGEDIVSLTMQDHYVEVTTTKGSELILMRLSDAIDELHPIEGHQLHRSHWAADAHMIALEKDGHRNFLRLSDLRKLPVSGTHLVTVQSALARGRKLQHAAKD